MASDTGSIQGPEPWGSHVPRGERRLGWNSVRPSLGTRTPSFSRPARTYSGHAPVAFARDFSIPSVSDPPTRTGVGRPSWRTASTKRPTDEYPAESRKDTSVNRTRPKAVWKALQLSQPVIPGSGPANLPMSICPESGRSLPARQAFIRFRDDLVRVCTGRPPVRTP